MKALLVLALLAVLAWVTLTYRRPAPDTWCTARPVEVCATIHPDPPATTRRTR